MNDQDRPNPPIDPQADWLVTGCLYLLGTIAFALLIGYIVTRGY